MKNDRQKTKTRPVRPQLYASRVHNKRSATFINFWIFFPGSAALLKDLFFLNLVRFDFNQNWVLYVQISWLCVLLFSSFPGARFIQGAASSLFDKFCRGYIYSLT